MYICLNRIISNYYEYPWFFFSKRYFMDSVGFVLELDANVKLFCEKSKKFYNITKRLIISEEQSTMDGYIGSAEPIMCKYGILFGLEIIINNSEYLEEISDYTICPITRYMVKYRFNEELRQLLTNNTCSQVTKELCKKLDI